jgi:hypothetical protein
MNPVDKCTDPRFTGHQEGSYHKSKSLSLPPTPNEDHHGSNDASDQHRHPGMRYGDLFGRFIPLAVSFQL